jgi:hypothetical protein
MSEFERTTRPHLDHPARAEACERGKAQGRARLGA